MIDTADHQSNLAAAAIGKLRSQLAVVVALLVALWAVWILETARAGLEITHMRVGETPVTLTQGAHAQDHETVFIAHGFAGSRQIMQAYANSLARAGYRVVSYDFLGHGRHLTPMDGDINNIDGTTRGLVAQTQEVITALAPKEGRFAVLGHSMATDILVRALPEDSDAPVILLSAFSNAVTADHPRNLLVIPGQWEARLITFAEEALHMVAPDADLGETVATQGITRRAFVAPYSEHVAILHARSAQIEAIAWLDQAFDRQSVVRIPLTGWAVLGLLAAIAALAAPLFATLPRTPLPAPLSVKKFTLIMGAPVLVAPIVTAPLDPQLLPVIVSDDLSLHLAVYGMVQLGLLAWWRRGFGAPSLKVTLLLLIWGLGVFGLALDRYGASFVATGDRLWIAAALAVGTVPFMLADAHITAGAPLWQKIAARICFFTSLAFAVILDFEGLFFVILIAPVILLFFLTYGVMGRFAARAGGPSSSGLGLGLVLAWALAVSFPLISG